MAIRGDNLPPSNTPGSITQTADSQIDRIGNISNVSKTVSNMQQDVKQRITETQTAVDEGQQVSMVQKSMTKVLDKLADTVGALSAGVKTITIDTARATKDSITQYGKAISEDISFNKQHTVAMALAKTTPIYGYFAAKFMETDVFKKAAERMKTSIGKAFGSLAGVFRRGGKGPGEDTAIPKMQSGGYVKKGGLTELHAGEIVAPIEKILKRIDDSISTTKDLAKITEKTALHMTTDLKGYIKSSSASDKSQMNIFRSFIRTYKEVGERAFTEQPVERMARSLLAIQDILGAQIGTQKQVWDEMLANHPTLVKMKLAWKATTGALTAPYRIFRAFMRVRGFGGYRTKLSKAKNPLQATAENIATLYVDLMWRLDNMMPLIKLSAVANRDTAAKLTGNSYPRIKGIPKEKKWSMNQAASAALGLIPGLAIGGVGKGVGKLGSKMFKGKTGAAFKKGGDISGNLAKWLITGGGPQEDKKGLLDRMGGGFRDLFIKQKEKVLLGEAKGDGAGTGGGIVVTVQGIQKQLEDYYNNFLPVYQEYIEQQKEITEWKLTDMRNEVDRKNLEHGVLLLEHKKAEIEYPKLIEEQKNKKKEKKRRKMFERAAQSSISMASRLRKFLTKDRIWKWITMAGTFISSIFGTIGSVLGGLFLPGGVIMTAIMGIGPLITAALASAPFWIAILAALGGAGIGTFIQRQIIGPYLSKREAEQRKVTEAYQKKEAEKTQQYVKEAREASQAPQNQANVVKTWKNRQLINMKRIGKSAAATQQMQGTGFFGEPMLAEIQMGMDQYRNQNIGEYLLYDAKGIMAMREEWDKKGHFRTRNVMRGEKAIDYGMKRETAFLAYLRGYGDNIKIADKIENIPAELMRRKKEKDQLKIIRKQQIEVRKQQKVPWSSGKEERMLEGKKTGLKAYTKRKRVEYETKLLQKINVAKGLGKDWWSRLDNKSRTAFQEAKKYYIKEFGMSEVEADAALQDFAMRVSDRYGLMTDIKTYKTFGREVEAEVRERMPQVIDKKNMLIKEATFILADGEKMAVEYGKEVKKQTKELVDSAKENTVAGTTAVVTSISETYNSVSSSPTVVTVGDKVQGVYQTGKDYASDLVLKGDSD